jgi:hypothetical protein
VDQGLALQDPLWHMPLWDAYHRGIESDIADIVNTGKGPMAGAINAALFLQDFVPATQPWMHIDLFAWNDSARPGRPVGGEAQTLRTLLAYLEQRFGAACRLSRGAEIWPVRQAGPLFGAFGPRTCHMRVTAGENRPHHWAEHRNP